MQPLVSIIIPTYNRSRSLEKLIHCLHNQTLKGIEILIIDQNKRGYLQEGLPKLILDGITHIYLDEPNVSKARNEGFRRSTGDILLFIDDDLLPKPDFCQKAIETMRRFPQIGCLCPLVIADQQGEERAFQRIQRHFTGARIDQTNIFEIKETISAAVFYTRNYFKESGGFDERLFRFAATAEDQELFIRMRRRRLRLWMDKTLCVFHDETVHGGCALRTSDFWQTRERCIRSWVFRYRIHGGRQGLLSVPDFYYLCRSVFLNRAVLKSGPMDIFKNIRLLSNAIDASKEYLKPYLEYYGNIYQINHLYDQKL